ncbi:calcium/sodium antiporter [Allobaculum fili]|uniref:calcium/sodium antiporter n=1 Tax=Allobaculum fili TaxID=2834460 RepID=UPI001E4A40BC|nr:calcium/sodium antiporter [Allobaculum fili]
MAYLWLIVGFVLLIKGADLFVDGASAAALKMKVSPVIVGLTIVALGTSLPEASVSISASIANSNALAISNVLGSNIFNTLVVVGASAAITPFVIHKTVLRRDMGVNIFCSLLLLLFLLGGNLSRVEGILLLIILAIYLYVLIRDAKKNPVEEDSNEKQMPTWKIPVLLLIGIAAIVLGGDITVDSAKEIAASLGMSENLIGLTVVSVGTSLPELVTSVTAAKKGESGLSIGNAIGSNILNILFILGASATISPLSADMFNVIDSAILLAVAIGMFALCWFSPKLNRTKGICMILVYCCFVAYTILR